MNKLTQSARVLASLNAGVFTGCQIALVPLFPFIAERSGLALAPVLGAFALGSALFVGGSPYWAERSDRAGRSPVLKRAAAGLAISLGLLLALVAGPRLPTYGALALLTLSRLVYGVFASAIVPVAQAWQQDAAGAEITTAANAAMTRHSVALSAGRLLALVGVVALAAFPLVLMAGLLASAVILLALNTRAGAGRPPRAASPAPSPCAAPSLLLAWPVFALAFFFTGSVELVNSSLSGTLRLVFQLDAADAARFVGQLLLGASAVVLLTQAVARRALRRSWRSPLVLGLLALLAGASLLAAATVRAEVWMALALISVALGLIPPAYLSALAGNGASRGARGRAAGILASTQTLGYAAGAGLSAWSFHFLPGERAPLLAGLTILALGAGFTLLFRRAPAEVRA